MLIMSMPIECFKTFDVRKKRARRVGGEGRTDQIGDRLPADE